uniref:H15 domain-containing protein n=1 Tax=Timema shepardi TaxID=629360 RepID=A0A7R9AMM5_TIMSH|nr:unnamed protein product [Timema shepardi]
MTGRLWSNPDAEKLAPFIKKYLKSAVTSGELVQTKGKGASGSFKLPVAPGKEGAKPAGPKKAPKEKKSTTAKKAPRAVGTPKKAKKVPAAVEKKKKVTPKPKKSPSKAKKVSRPPTKKPRAPKPKKVTPKAKTPKKPAPKKK